MSSRPTFDNEIAARIVAQFASVPGGLLPALHEMQGAFGHVPREALKLLAKGFNITEAETYGVASFYHDFQARSSARKARAQALPRGSVPGRWR